jgi:hypothetical protein
MVIVYKPWISGDVFSTRNMNIFFSRHKDKISLIFKKIPKNIKDKFGFGYWIVKKSEGVELDWRQVRIHRCVCLVLDIIN